MRGCIIRYFPHVWAGSLPPARGSYRTGSARKGAGRSACSTVRALPGRLSALSVPQHFPMKIHFVGGFCVGAQGA
jgi:hypothetical protein